MTDRPFLQQYAATADAAAFVELVRRHGPMVHAAARRMAGGDADDVAQAAFILLSRKAASLAGRDCVAGWLYETTRLCARNARRARGRREHALNAFQEQVMRTQPPTDEPAWLAVLDDALEQLPGDQKGVVLLRYLEGRSVADTAALLRLTPAAVAKRAERAIGRLRQTFRAQGYTVSAEQAAFGMSLRTGVDPGQIGMLSNVSTKSATAGASATAKSAGTAMMLAKVKVAAVLVAMAAAGGGAAVPVVRHAMAKPAMMAASLATSQSTAVATTTLEDIPAMRRTLAVLDKQSTAEVSFDRVSLKDVMSFLTDTLNLPIDLDVVDLAAHGIDVNAPVSARPRNVKANKILQTVLLAVGQGAPLTHVVTSSGRIYVGTRQTAFARLAVERRHPADDLIESASHGADRSSLPSLRAQLTSLVTETVSVDTWQGDGRTPGGQSRWDGDTLVVTQTPDTQLKIADLFANLRSQRASPSVAQPAAGGRP